MALSGVVALAAHPGLALVGLCVAALVTFALCAGFLGSVDYEHFHGSPDAGLAVVDSFGNLGGFLGLIRFGIDRRQRHRGTSLAERVKVTADASPAGERTRRGHLLGPVDPGDITATAVYLASDAPWVAARRVLSADSEFTFPWVFCCTIVLCRDA